VAALAAGVASLLLAVVASAPLGAAGVALAAGIAAYVALNRRLGRRVAEARAALAEGSAAPPGAGDELDDLVDDAARAGRALRTEVDRLGRLADHRRSFLGDVSHELRTPIFAISGFAESLLDGALDDPRVRRRFVEKILTNARRLDALAHDLAEIARIESGELRMRPERFDVGPFVRETVEAFEQLASERRVSLSSELADGLPAGHGDRARLNQVLANLVENAVKYTEPGGHVSVAATPADDGVRIAVTDDGIGISPEDLARVTERFFRVDRSRARGGGGTGLGLSIAKHILEAHGLSLAMASRPGEGSTFGFTIPYARAEAGGGTTQRESRVSAPSPPGR
jgi:two-component system phosphate regulon sensor histidine kinase PhoR